MWGSERKASCAICFESLRGLQHSSVSEKTGRSSLSLQLLPPTTRPLPPFPIPLFWVVFRGSPVALVMCAAGEGGCVTLILPPGSGKYSASLRTERKQQRAECGCSPGAQSAHQNVSCVTACCSPPTRGPSLFSLPLSVSLSHSLSVSTPTLFSFFFF